VFFPQARLFDSNKVPVFTRGRCHGRFGGGRPAFRFDFSATQFPL